MSLFGNHRAFRLILLTLTVCCCAATSGATRDECQDVYNEDLASCAPISRFSPHYAGICRQHASEKRDLCWGDPTHPGPWPVLDGRIPRCVHEASRAATVCANDISDQQDFKTRCFGHRGDFFGFCLSFVSEEHPDWRVFEYGVAANCTQDGLTQIKRCAEIIYHPWYSVCRLVAHDDIGVCYFEKEPTWKPTSTLIAECTKEFEEHHDRCTRIGDEDARARCFIRVRLQYRDCMNLPADRKM